MAEERSRVYDDIDFGRRTLGPASEGSVKERRSTIWNDNDIADGTLPDNIREGVHYRGKFFTRGCRGMIEQIQLYCLGTGAANITLRWSPFPGIGPFGEATIAPAAAWAWQDFDVEEMWNYDSLFIWVSATHAAVDWAYDTEEPYDGHISPDAGATWADSATRPFMRAVYTGETPGDVPVSGIINTIEIPSIGTQSDPSLGINLDHNAEVQGLAPQHGSGTLVQAHATFYTSVAPTAGAPPAAVYYRMVIITESGIAVIISNRDLTQSAVATSGRCAIGEFYQIEVADPAYDRTVMSVRLPIKFQRIINVGLLQTTGGAVDADIYLSANVLR